MAKTRPNDPCPCGSGKKYKRCCHEKDQAAASAELAAKAANASAAASALPQWAWEPNELDQDSNAVVDLVHAGKLDEAERAAHDLLERYPEVHDGWDRLGMVYEARGDKKKAADCYRKVVAFIDAHPEGYDPEVAESFRSMIAELDPPSST